MKTLILCGGKGTRAYPYTAELPKPLFEVAGRPILAHVMDIFAEQGHDEFVLASGYLHHRIEEFASTLPSSWAVDVVDTGESTNTAARVALCRHMLGETFFVTYGDGLGNIDVEALLGRHRRHNGSATVTTVPLPSPYGTLELGDAGRVDRFCEKPVLRDHWINAGFMVFEQRTFEHWCDDDLERGVLPRLAAAGELYAYRHRGFWKSMDTYKDCLELTALCTASDDADGRAPWNRYATAASW